MHLFKNNNFGNRTLLEEMQKRLCVRIVDQQTTIMTKHCPLSDMLTEQKTSKISLKSMKIPR